MYFSADDEGKKVREGQKEENEEEEEDRETGGLSKGTIRLAAEALHWKARHVSDGLRLIA